MDLIQKELLEEIAGLHEVPAGAYNIRANGKAAARNTTANIDIVSKEDKPGIDIIIKPGTKKESVHIPVVISQTGLNDLVYNDFHIGEDCDVTIVAGCGIHNSGDGLSQHDGVGFVKNLEVNGVDVKGKKTVVLGAGGAATAIQVQLALDGASEVAIFNIDDEFYARAESTKEKLATRCPECKVTVEHLENKEALAAAVNNADIVINATIMGMKPHEDVTLIDKSLFRKDLVVADTVYNPEKTKMILEAEEAGCQAIGGKGMLLYQGVVNYSLFTGKDFPIEEYQKFQAEQAK